MAGWSLSMPESMTPTFTPAPVLSPHAHSGVMFSSPFRVGSCWIWPGVNCQLQAGRLSYNGRVIMPQHLSLVNLLVGMQVIGMQVGHDGLGYFDAHATARVAVVSHHPQQPGQLQYVMVLGAGLGVGHEGRHLGRHVTLLVLIGEQRAEER